MYRTSIDLGKITAQMKLSFNVIIDIDTSKTKGGSFDTIQRFKYGGNDYLKYAPNPYIKIDISRAGDKNDTWGAGTFVNVNQRSCFSLLSALNQIIKSFSDPKLYYTMSGRLYVRPELVEQYSESVLCGTSKVVKLMHAVVPDKENVEIENEGIIFMVNTVDNFTYLTYEDILYLKQMLESTNYQTLSAILVQSYILERILGDKTPVQTQTIMKPFTEETESLPDKVDSKYVRREPTTNAIPEI